MVAPILVTVLIAAALVALTAPVLYLTRESLRREEHSPRGGAG